MLLFARGDKYSLLKQTAGGQKTNQTRLSKAHDPRETIKSVPIQPQSKAIQPTLLTDTARITVRISNSFL